MIARGLICVFAKPPIPGKVKTRLASEIGDARAATLAQAFLRDTWSIASRMPWAKTILSSPEGIPSDFGVPGQPTLWLQGDGDLGNRLECTIRRGLRQADFVIAIGADSPGLPERLLVEARDKLERTDAVLGPAQDGGFYLIGLRRCPPGLFDDLPWSMPTTFSAMRERLEQLNLSVSLLKLWFDVDRPEDVDRLRSMIQRGELYARETAALLMTHA